MSIRRRIFRQFRPPKYRGTSQSRPICARNYGVHRRSLRFICTLIAAKWFWRIGTPTEWDSGYRTQRFRVKIAFRVFFWIPAVTWVSWPFGKWPVHGATWWRFVFSFVRPRSEFCLHFCRPKTFTPIVAPDGIHRRHPIRPTIKVTEKHRWCIIVPSVWGKKPYTVLVLSDGFRGVHCERTGARPDRRTASLPDTTDNFLSTVLRCDKTAQVLGPRRVLWLRVRQKRRGPFRRRR